MAYKDNLLKKITIDRLARSIASEIGPVDSGRRIDKSSLQQLIRYFPWPHKEEREMDLYIEDASAGKTRILVLDNDLTLYRTTVDDVLLRKNPTVKEMVSIRNAIKILNDKDVVVSRKEVTLQTVQQICIGELDLTYTDADINAMAQEGKSLLESGDASGVQESLALFAELLNLDAAPKSFSMRHYDIYGKIDRTPQGDTVFGPLVMFSLADNSLTCLDTPLRGRDKGRFERLKAVAAGKEEAAASGGRVFDLMAEKVPASGTVA